MDTGSQAHFHIGMQSERSLDYKLNKNRMFQNVSAEQVGRIISIFSLLLGVSVDEANTTVHVISVIGIAAMQVWGYIRRFKKGDVTALGARK